MPSWLKRFAWPLAALLSLLAYLLRPRSRWDDDDQRQAEAEKQARGEAIDERRKRKEAEANAEFEKKRAGTLRDRIAGALERAGQGLTEVQADSLVSYIELLEFDLAVCDIRHDAQSDSLRVNLDIMSYRLAMAEKEKARWYHDPRLWFLVGAVSATVVLGTTLNITF